MGTPPAGRGLTPARPHEFFGTPWAGEGEFVPRPWLRWLPGPRRLRFSSATSWLSDSLWLFHDTLTWDDGRVERRDGTARLIADDRIAVTYDGMLGGASIELSDDGFQFSPYRLLVDAPPLPLPVVVSAVDTCSWDPQRGELRDVIELRCAGIPLGRLVMTLRPVG